MRAKNILLSRLEEIVAELKLDWPEKVQIEPPKDKKFGDLAINIAMTLSRQSGLPPRETASILARRLQEKEPALANVEIAGPGFLNLTYADAFWQDTVRIILESGGDYGKSDVGRGRKTQVEFVSANPTGPLHIGHGRGAAIGDTLARLLRFAGYDVQTEYYINDAGKQMRLLGLSVRLRVLELAGRPVDWPKDWYKGAYIKDLAAEMLKNWPDLPDRPEAEALDFCFEYAQDRIMQGIKKDLADFRVAHDRWFSERTLVADGSVDKTFARLKQSGHIFEHEGALWFKTATMGDDLDRVLRKSDGYLTYFASDIAYHANKYDRGFDLVVDVWGADHHGYIPRMRAAIASLGRAQEDFEVVLVQLVNLLDNGKQIAMSTRQGQFETLADVLTEVGTDAARFMFLSRKSDSPLNFDLNLVKQRTLDNPVYYVQYAHARIHAILRRAAEKNIKLAKDNSGEFSGYLVEGRELSLLRKADDFPEVVASAAMNLAPHHISFYLMELARELHAYYASVQVLNARDANMAAARLDLLRAVAHVLKNGLELLGVNAPENM
ncbi:MAG: arginine--tRNA ligase [Deltaproteobacteria bacterium]|jgi:arginyl-tRNA synthetase|nr:arginine--tRNA ligase [Deltaproteobacteria bacterium]